MSTWMIVEDTPDLYELLLAMFGVWGIDGVAFIDGEETIAWIEDVEKGRARGEVPELALIDIKLAGEIDGLQVCERIRRSPVLKNMALVVISALIDTNYSREAIYALGVDEVIAKPLPNFPDFKAQLEGVLRQRRAGIVRSGLDTIVATAVPRPIDASTVEIPRAATLEGGRPARTSEMSTRTDEYMPNSMPSLPPDSSAS